MSTYRAPLRDMQFVLKELAGVDDVAKLPGYEETSDVLDAILEEAGNFASEVLDPINQSGDKEGCTWRDGEVTTPKGFKEAYAQFAKAGWIGLPVPPEFGGQGLPQLILGPTLEMWNGANVGFANGPLLNQGAIEAIELCGSDEQKQMYIPKLVSGEWTGTMCLTEPQAGSDLAAVRSKAVPEGDHYKISGQKIFITFGEHDLAPNIVHLVLARLPDAPEGTKGISLFIVPKFLVKPDGSLGERNDVHCASIEHKLGINANPTCTLNYGERTGGAIGYLVGEPNRGLEYMFIMMNAARFSVGVQGLAIADRAYQSALAYAKERVQSRDIKDFASRGAQPTTIFHHPDVRRMLMWMKAQIEAMRALAYVTAASLDYSNKAQDEATRKEHRAFVEFMIPIVKGWCTEVAIDVCSTALQVFGGMGYIEETGIAQQYRDVRITAIYEGTTGIQALDLVGRKLIRDMGTTATAIGKKLHTFAASLESEENADVKAIAAELGRGLEALTKTSQAIGMSAMSDLRNGVACSVPYLKLWGIVAGGWQMARAAQIAAAKIAANDSESDFYKAKLATARFYADHVLTQARWLAAEIQQGVPSVMALSAEQFELDRKAAVTV
ncbi:MAG: acyl-CoA dehydrogenase C-terminal domain-containing protein [Candidatus Eremiobacteraeota bacterium]|nr:acyl-CoA dehydrogenase C-terminal domain-containing protein [Candidatus Eremiobacteraeota bacterium]